MYCHDAKEWLGAQCDGYRAFLLAPALQEHLKQCPACRAFLQRQHHLEGVLDTPTPLIRASISTSQIMRAIREQKRIFPTTRGYPSATTYPHGTFTSSGSC